MLLHKIVISLLALPLAFLSEPGCSRANDDSLLEVLDAAVNQWRGDISFRSTFSFRQGIATTKGEALAGQFGSHVGNASQEDRATGTFHKLGSQMRFGIDFGHPPEDASLDGSGGIVTNVSFDGVVAGDLYLDYLPPYPSFGDQLTIFRRPDRDAGVLKAATDGDVIINPFSFAGGVAGSPIKAFSPRPEFSETVEKRVVEQPNDRLLVEMERISKTSNGEIVRQKLQLTFRMSTSPPVTERREQVAVNEATGVRSEGCEVGTDFAQCEGGVMARCVRSATGPLTVGGTAEPLWVAREWISADLGAQVPTAEDFVVEIPPSVRVVGVKHPPPRGIVRRIDLSTYSIDDLASYDVGPQVAGADRAARAAGDEDFSDKQVALGVLAALMGSMLLWLSVRGRRRTRPFPLE